jgi:hypothetical protein
MGAQHVNMLGLSQARKRWQWAYVAAYLSALITFASGFIIQDDRGRPGVGFDPFSVAGSCVIALILVALAWGVQKKSLICASTLFLLFAASGVLLLLDEEGTEGKDIFGAVVFSVLLFRGILGLRMLKKAEKEKTCPSSAPSDRRV